MTLSDLQQRVKRIGDPYKVDREKRARRLFIEERAAALKGHREQEFELKSKIAARMDIRYSSVSFTGSAQLGFSVLKETLFQPKVSDLDVACIDVNLFQRAWTDVNRTTKAFNDLSVFGSLGQEQIDIFQSQILKRGMIRVGVMPVSILSRQWRALEAELSRSYAFVFKSVSLAVYINEYAFCWKQDSALSNLDAIG